MKLGTFAVLLYAFSATLRAEIRIASLEPTVLFPNQEPLRQVALLHLNNNSAEPAKVSIRVAVDGTGAAQDFEAEVAPGNSTQRVLIPDLQTPAPLTIEIRAGKAGPVLASHRQTWSPQRHWKVFIVKSSHEDLGYEGYIFDKQHDIANYIDEARWLSRPRENVAPAGAGPDGGYHYTMETLLFQRDYIEERSESAWRDVAENAVKPGQMHLMGAPVGVHSHWMDYEELARMTYPARRDARDRFGLDLKTFMIIDNPSLSWSGCQALAAAGFSYVARWGQPWRTGGNNDYAHTKLPALFWWVAPDQQHRVLFGWRSHYGLSLWYGQPGGGYSNLLETGVENLSHELKQVESGERLGPYPYDALVNPEYVDHDIPHADARVLPELIRRYRYPEIRIASPTEFFEYVEHKYAANLPSLSGDLNNFSADYATIDPDSQGWKRRAARLLPLAEGLGAIAGLLDGSFLPPGALINRTFQRLFDYDEHSWPTQPRASDVQLFNAQWVKQKEAERALAGAQQALDTTFGALARHVPTGSEESLLVFNPLAHARSGPVEVDGALDGLIDAVTGKPVPVQQIPEGKTLFVATGVPAFGYKIYRLAHVTSAPSAMEATEETLANRYYTIRFDRATGVIRSLYDKELKRELIDPAARHGFNQMIYHETKTRESPESKEHSPEHAAGMEHHVGPVRAEFTVKLDDPLSGAGITQTVILYDQLKRIDVIDRLQHVRSFYSDNYEDRYRSNIYYAFPIQVEDFETRVEYPGGVVRPYTDQLRWGSHDYLYANRWVDVSNRAFGVTMAPWNAGTVNLGEIRYNQFSIDYKPASSHIFSYAYSNRMAGLLTLNGDDCNATLGYSFTSHSGEWNEGGAPEFGWQVASPLIARRLPAAQQGSLSGAQSSFVSVNAKNVQLITLKQSEQPGRGWIARLVETEGRPAKVDLRLPGFPVTGAMECDLVENDLRPLQVTGGVAHVTIPPFAFATVRIFSADPEPAQPTNIRAAAVSDKSIRLQWTGHPGALYNIYRSEDASAPPTAYTLVNRTAVPEFTDDGLKIATPYYYSVAAVSPANRQGPISQQIKMSTSTRNTSPPAPVEELGVVRRAKDRLIVYWRKSPDPDIARFYIYRGDSPNFRIEGSVPIGEVIPSGRFLEIYQDRELTPGKTYYYRVQSEDWSANRQQVSPVASATTPAY